MPPVKAAEIRGVVGQVKWHYYTAAAINNYTVTRSVHNAWTLRATVVLSDDFKMSQQPLVFVAPHQAGAWRWPIVSHVIADGTLSAQLGQPDV
jgi:hypothetical protein